MVEMDETVECLEGIGKQRAEMLAACGVRTLGDLLDHIPFRYEDRSRFRPISSLAENEWALIRGEVRRIGGYRTRRKGFSIVEMLSTCNTNWRVSPLEALKMIEREMIPYFPLGVFKERTGKDFL